MQKVLRSRFQVNYAPIMERSKLSSVEVLVEGRNVLRVLTRGRAADNTPKQITEIAHS